MAETQPNAGNAPDNIIENVRLHPRLVDVPSEGLSHAANFMVVVTANLPEAVSGEKSGLLKNAKLQKLAVGSITKFIPQDGSENGFIWSTRYQRYRGNLYAQPADVILAGLEKVNSVVYAQTSDNLSKLFLGLVITPDDPNVMELVWKRDIKEIKNIIQSKSSQTNKLATYQEDVRNSETKSEAEENTIVDKNEEQVFKVNFIPETIPPPRKRKRSFARTAPAVDPKAPQPTPLHKQWLKNENNN